MRYRLWPLLLLLSAHARPQSLQLADRPVAQFEVHGDSRLAALARLGAMTHTSLLVETGSMPFLQAPIELTLHDTSVDAIIARILRGPEHYVIRQQGALLILSVPDVPSRIPTLQLGPISSKAKSLEDLIPMLGFYVSAATGCAQQGYGVSGSPLVLDIPPFDLAAATLEEVAAKVAEAPEPTMWIVQPDPTTSGCIDDPLAHWEVGLYGFGRGFSDCDTPFRGSLGATFIVDKLKFAPNTACREPHLPTAAPTF